MVERLTVVARCVPCAEGVWTRIKGPLSGAWYGPWRFTQFADPTVECAYPPCVQRLRESSFPGPQWCSKEHRLRTTEGKPIWMPPKAKRGAPCQHTPEQVEALINGRWHKPGEPIEDPEPDDLSGSTNAPRDAS